MAATISFQSPTNLQERVMKQGNAREIQTVKHLRPRLSVMSCKDIKKLRGKQILLLPNNISKHRVVLTR